MPGEAAATAVSDAAVDDDAPTDPGFTLQPEAGRVAPVTADLPRAGTVVEAPAGPPATRAPGRFRGFPLRPRLARLPRLPRLRRRGRPESGLAAWAFAAITVLPALVLLAWLAVGQALLLAGRFLPLPMLLISAPAAVGLTMAVASRSVPGRWPGTGMGQWAGRTRSRPWAVWLGLTGTVAVAAGFGVWQGLLRSPQLIVDRDPGAATQLGFWIAEYGSLPVTRSFAAFGGAHPGLAFSSFGFAAHGAALVPQAPPGLPIALAAGLWAHGLAGAAVLPPVLGAFAVLAVGGLAGRLAGPVWAPAGALLLALTLPEMYTSRSAFSEILAQALLFGGLCLVIDSLGARQSRVLAAVGGLTLGMAASTDPAFVVVLLPAIPFVAVLAGGRRPQALALGVGLLAGAGYGLAGDLVLNGPAPVASALRPGALAIVAFAGVTAISLTLALVGPVRRSLAPWLAARPLRWLPEAAAAVVVAAVVAAAVRPYAQTVRGPASAYVAALQRIAYLPVDPGRQYSEDSLYWVIWYLGAPALVLAAAGLALLAARCLRAMLTWRDASGSARAWALPLGVIAWGTVSVLWRPGTVPDQPWASRVLVPVVLPGLVVCAVWMVGWLIARARERGAGVLAVLVAVVCFAGGLAGPVAVSTFGVGARWSGQPGLGPQPGGIAFQRTGAGEEAAVRRLCAAIPSNASAVIVDPVAARRFAPVIRGMCAIPVGVTANASAAQVQAVISGVEQAGRRPVLFAARPAELAPYLAQPNEVVNLPTRQDAHVLTQPPASTWPVRYTLWMAVPGGVGTATGA